MRRLRRLALWGTAAAATLLLAVLVSRSEMGSQRVSAIVASLTGRAAQPDRVAKPPFDAQGETRRLQEAMRVLADDRDRLMTRVAALEQNLDMVTGSVTRQLEAVHNAPAAAPWPIELAPVPTAPETIAATVAPAAAAAPLTGLPLAVHDVPPLPSAERSDADTALGVDLGGALTVQALRARWHAIRTAHAELFEGLRPVVSVRDLPKPNRVELRLVVGPLANAGVAEQLCTSLAATRLPCQPAVFDGQRLAQN